MAGVDEAGLEAAAHAVDDGLAARVVAAFEGQQVDVEDLAHVAATVATPPTVA